MRSCVLRSGENTMPTELELNRLVSSIQDLLFSASDVCHDRCVKVLTARAKVTKETAAELRSRDQHTAVTSRV